MTRVRWRWEEKDFGLRFRRGHGRKTSEYYQTNDGTQFYVVPAGQRKLSKARADELTSSTSPPDSFKEVENPWRDYDRDWDWIVALDGLCLNVAGCLDREEINRREDEGVGRAMEFVAGLVERSEPAPLTIDLIRRVHYELMGAIYPFAGEWRTVGLHKGDGPEKWPLPPTGIRAVMDVLDRDVLSRSPVISSDNEVVYSFASEVMNEMLAIHPFREGNGRAAFILGNLILMQNDLLPLDVYDRVADEQRYFAACEDGRIHKNYGPLADLVAEWEAAALDRWEDSRGEE